MNKTVILCAFLLGTIGFVAEVTAKEALKKASQESKKKKPGKNDNMWDGIAQAFGKNYIEKHPDHFIPQMSYNVKMVMAMQNAIPPLINLDDDMVVLLIKYVTGKQGEEVDLEPYGFDHTTMLQELTSALNRQVDITNAETKETRKQLEAEGYTFKDIPMKEVKASQKSRNAKMTIKEEIEFEEKGEGDEDEDNE